MLPTGLGRGATFSPFVPLLWLACICVPLVRPPRTPGEACPPALSFPGLMRLAEVDEGPISISNTSVGEEALPTYGWIHALHLMRFICVERQKETRCQRGHVPIRLL